MSDNNQIFFSENVVYIVWSIYILLYFINI
jgi:hypothetical protein